MAFFKKRKDKTLAVEQKSTEELRASIEEKLANYDPDKDTGPTIFSPLPLPTCPSDTERDIRSRIVVRDPEGELTDRDVAQEHIRTRGTDQVGKCEDLSDLIAPIPESDFSVDWMEVGDDVVEVVRTATEHFWTTCGDRWGEGK